MITRENRRLIGKVHKVEAEFAVFEIIDEKAVETRHQPRYPQENPFAEANLGLSRESRCASSTLYQSGEYIPKVFDLKEQSLAMQKSPSRIDT